VIRDILNHLGPWLAPPGNQAANGENKHQPVYRKKPVHSTQKKWIVEGNMVLAEWTVEKANIGGTTIADGKGCKILLDKEKQPHYIFSIRKQSLIKSRLLKVFSKNSISPASRPFGCSTRRIASRTRKPRTRFADVSMPWPSALWIKLRSGDCWKKLRRLCPEQTFRDRGIMLVKNRLKAGR
jgi:hypothetical protein